MFYSNNGGGIQPLRLSQSVEDLLWWIAQHRNDALQIAETEDVILWVLSRLKSNPQLLRPVLTKSCKDRGYVFEISGPPRRVGYGSIMIEFVYEEGDEFTKVIEICCEPCLKNFSKEREPVRRA